MSHALVGQVEYRISTAYLSQECNKKFKVYNIIHSKS